MDHPDLEVSLFRQAAGVYAVDLRLAINPHAVELHSMRRAGQHRRNLYAHVAAEIDLEAGRIQEAQGVRRYLESYFDQEADISIFWGSIADFTSELARRIK